jgi:hypothetical protein
MAQDPKIDVKFDPAVSNTLAVAKLAQAGMVATIEKMPGLRCQSRLQMVAGEQPRIIDLPIPNRWLRVEHLQDLRRVFDDMLDMDDREARGNPAVFVAAGVRTGEVQMVFDRRTGYEGATFDVQSPVELDRLLALATPTEMRGDELLRFLRYDVPAAAPPGLERAVQKVTWRHDQASVEERARGKESLGSSAAAAVDDDALAAIGPLQAFRVPYFAELGLRDLGTLEVHLDPKPAERTWHLQITHASLDSFRVARLEYLVERTREVFEGAEIGVYAGAFGTDCD